jgi:hypothetical protein
MPSTVLADQARAERKRFIAGRLSAELLDQVDQLAQDLRTTPFDQAALQAQADAIVTLTCVIHDELAELD